MVIFNSKQKKFEGDLKRKWKEQMLSFSKWGNMLVLKYLDLSILVFLKPTYLTAVLSGLRIVALFNKLWFYRKRQLESLIFNREIPIPVPYSNNFILKVQNKICLENILFSSKSLNNLTPSVFSKWFRLSSDQHNYETSSSTQGNLTKLFYKTNRYGKYLITVSAVESWNNIQSQLKDTLLKDLTPRKIKTIVSNSYLKSY